MKNKTLGIVVVAIIVVIAGYLLMRPKAETPVVTPNNGQNTATPNTPVTTGPAPVSKQSALLMSGNVADLVAFSVIPNTKVVAGAQIMGTIKGGYFFEGNMVGKLLDKNKKVLKTFGITATTDWMTAGPVSFSFTYDTAGGPVGQGYIRLENDNPSGDPKNVKYVDIPVIF